MIGSAPSESRGESPTGLLTPRQLEIVDRLTRPGATARSVAAELGISEHTVKRHLEKAYRLNGVQSLAQLTRKVFGWPPA
jgi:two-component system, NarL family, nitrate/nitrite response regulator NarL